MVKGSYIKIIGLKFDALEGLQITTDSNVGNHKEAGEFAERHKEANTIFVGIPCDCTLESK